MKRTIITLLAATTLAAAVPAIASAQPYRGDRYERDFDRGAWQNINQRQANLDRRIDRALRNGAISPREARSLRAEFNAIANLEARYRATRPGLTFQERADLDRRFDALSARIRYERMDGNRYGYGYGPAYR